MFEENCHSHKDTSERALLEAQARLMQVRRAISKLKEEEKKLENFICATQSPDHDNSAHHSCRIPLELWLNVFEHFHRDSDRDSIDVGGSPWVLTHVCHEWREFVTATPQLWTKIRIRAAECGYHLKSTMFRLNQQLNYSRDRPLRIDIDAEHIHPHAVDLILYTLLLHRSRWENVTICKLDNVGFLSKSGSTSVVSEKFSPHRPIFPILSSLSLGREVPFTQSGGEQEQWASGGLHWTVQDAPCLTRLELHQVNMAGNSVPWGQLAKVDLTDVSAMQAFSVLPSLRDVTHLSLKFRSPPAFSLAFDRFLCFPHLESIKISGRENDLFSSITAPQLKKLEIGTPSYDDIGSLLSLIERSGCILAELIIGSGEIAYSEITSLYEALRSLKYLRMEMDGFCGELARLTLKPLLILDAEQSWYCPGLRYVSVESDWPGRGRVSSRLFFRRVIGDISAECFNMTMKDGLPADRHYIRVTITATDSFDGQDVNDLMEL